MSRFSFIKTISDRIRAKRYVGLLSSWLPIDSKNWGKEDYLRAYDISLYTNKAIGKRAEKVGETEFIVKNPKGEVLKNEPLLNLLYKPNKLYTGRQFWGLWSTYYDLIGETFILVERTTGFGDSTGKVTGLHMLIPDRVEIVWDTENPGTVKEYKYKNGTKETTYPATNVIYIFRPDPSNPMRGTSLLKAGVNAIKTETQIAEYHSRVLANGGKVEGVFKFKTPHLTAEQLKDVKENYDKEYAGAKKAGKPLFMGGDVDYQRMGLSPDELSFLEAKKTTLEDICIMTGTPKTVLASLDDVKYDNADASIRIFLRETIKPQVTTLVTALDEVLFPDGRNLSFTDPTPENVQEKIKETESGIKNYYMTINEARERHGLSPIKGGDDIKVPFNLMNLGDNPASATGKSMQKGIESIHPNSDPEIRKMWYEIQIKRMDAREKKFITMLKKYFNEQEDRIIEKLNPEQTRVFRRAGLIEDTMNITLETKIGKELFFPVLAGLLEEAGADALEYAGSEYKFNITSEMSGWLEQKADVFLNRINETTFNTLKEQFRQSFEASEGREKLIGRVRDTYKDITVGRAATIARTEVHASTQYGTMEGYKQGGLQIKIWASVNDSSTRDTHAAQDGEERPINTPFSNGLMFPGDPMGSAEEVINCRCVI